MSALEERIKIALQRKESDIITEAELAHVKIFENNDPLASVTDFLDCTIAMKPVRREYAKEDKLYARRAVCRKLAEASESLSKGFKFKILDAYRPIEYQKLRYEAAYAKIREQHKDWDDVSLRREVFKYVFPPEVDPAKPPAHSTGGAIDLTIMDENGDELDMGCIYGGDYSDKQYQQMILTNSSIVNEAQRGNRILLIKTLLRVNFSNYPGEWWHFMYGDREWAAYKNEPHAIYGRADSIRADR